MDNTNSKNSNLNKKEKKNQNKNVLKVIEAIKSPVTLGMILTFIFLFTSQTYYSILKQTEGDRIFNHPFRNFIFNSIEFIDQKITDLRFKIRGPISPANNVVLVAIDDRSVEEIGRWPWSREKTSSLIDELIKNGANAVGFDAIFSEPQITGVKESLERISNTNEIPSSLKKVFDSELQLAEPDAIFGQSVEKNKDKVVLGVFNEDSRHDFVPYQDYCRNEAFKRANAEKFVKMNTTFIVDDLADPFVDLEFDKAFEQIFTLLEKVNTEEFLKSSFHKPSVTDLKPEEIRRLRYLLEEGNMAYCEKWLTDKDVFLEPLKEIYLTIFKKSKDLENLDLPTAISVFKSKVLPSPIPQHQRWTINTDLIQEPASYTASFNADQDKDGTIRKASMFFRTGNRFGLSFIPSLGLQTYLIATGYRANVELNVDPKNKRQKIITSFNIIKPGEGNSEDEIIYEVPVNEQGRSLINFAGGRNTYTYLAAKELFNEKDTVVISKAEQDPATKTWYSVEREVKKADFIKNKTFIIGATAIGIYDLRVTPFEPNYPGPETHVNVVGNLFNKNFLKSHPKEPIIMFWGLLLFGALLSFIISHTSAVPGFTITFGSLAALFLLDQYLFRKNILATTTLPGLLILFLYIFLFFYKYLTEERKKKYLRSTFSKYVSPAIVDEILKDPDNIELGGKKMRMSVFFSDVRGFTTISEKLDPQMLSDVLNRYLSPMTQIVFANKGTLDKYMGDAVMAFFGAPIPFDDHAKHACRCALQSLVKLKELQQQFKEQGLPEIDIGIGINSGDMNVGNMGSDTVRSYTVMGDAVNLGSRLEGINKEYGTRIIISQFTYNDVKDSFAAREVDWVRVKGKNEPVRIFELICEGKPASDTEKMLNEFSSGFNLYHEKKFIEAKSHFQKALEIMPSDAPSELYLERCEDYIAEPPPENWDGVYVMKTK